MNKKMFIALIKTGLSNKNKIYIMACNDGSNAIQAFPSMRKAVSFFEDAYNSNHSRSFEASMSACVNFMYFQPSIVEVSGIEEIKEKIAAEKPRPYKMSCIAGFMVGINTRKGAVQYWEKGQKPQLSQTE